MVDVPRADKSGAEVTADAPRVPATIEFREASWSAPALPPLRCDGGWRFGCFHKARNSKPFLPRRNQRLMQSQNNAGHHIMAQIGLAPETG